MSRFQLVFYSLFILGICVVTAQVSPDCGNAVPICNNTPVNGGTIGLGIDDFSGYSASGCLEEALSGSIESNSAWYRFRTGASGQLGVNIGIETSEDWDFALYKTNDCNNLGDPVRCNFFDNQDGNSFIGVGEDPSGTTANVQYEDWLQVEPGEDYYLLINNFSNNNSGFSIQFSGYIFVTNPYDALDCSIINNLLGPPISACENDTVILDATTAGAASYNWFIDAGSGFIQIAGEHNPTLSATTSALYRVEVVHPMGNIISEVQVAFSEMPIANAVSDDASCTGSETYTLFQKDAEVIGTQPPNNFLVSYYLSLTDATNGSNVLPKQYATQSGSQTIYIRLSSIDNPRCFDVSQSFRLINLATPILDFPSEAYLCESDSGITIGEDEPSANYTYSWDTGETTPTITVSKSGSYTLIATNTQSGLSCDDSRTVTVTTSSPPQIINIEIEDLRNNNMVTVITEMADGFEFQLDDGPLAKAVMRSNS